ncbi:DHH family phosphoesterase [Natribacillus halophilus]|uniref:Cyclic-di-AMP phosphodiesterase n=1 Tax=Natribacillus halophilus TaxID=549003 RepID=A0A1G8L1H3_9BACI|nr:DHH family phosphoesterase [Natribacillus halophilus]SDI49488.1 c-di-AMP phosphodiesterase, consists of a GGDEF-like and DHH domains [Natribacillus halophilus]
MPNLLKKHWYYYPIVFVFVIAVVMNTILAFFQWQLALVGFAILIGFGWLAYYVLKQVQADLAKYISTLSHRVNRAGEKAVTNLPVGILLYDQNEHIQWVNPYLHAYLPDEYLGKSITALSSDLPGLLQNKQTEHHLQMNDREYYVYQRAEERLLYFFDMTETVQTQELYDQEQMVIAHILLDNYDDVTQGLDDQVTSRLRGGVLSLLNQWANEHNIFLRSVADDRFIALLDYQILTDIETNRFQIIDDIRERTSKENVALTLSIGIGSGEKTPRELGALAQSSLDLALGRGGDQVVIKERNGQVRFYGGKSNAIEKRTRVRARVISHALRDFVLESDQVIVMGHKNPDMDAIGAGIGVLKVAEVNEKDAYIVVDPDEVSPDVQKLMDEVEQHEYLWSRFITPSESLEHLTRQTLLVVVDTHKPSLVIEPKLLNRVHRVVVLDHHRRGEEFIDDPALVYMEPYASSASELVTELLEYQPKRVSMDALEATAMLAGMMVDTKNFSIRTGSRTFDAASYLKANGADTTAVQLLLKEDLDQYIQRSRLIEKAYIYHDGMAIARNEDEAYYHQVLIAQTADTLLTMNGIKGSFVISKLKDQRVSISARSLGDVNVQIIMEKLGGGGHLTNAAVQLDTVSLSEAENRLQTAIDEYLEGGSTD